MALRQVNFNLTILKLYADGTWKTCDIDGGDLVFPEVMSPDLVQYTLEARLISDTPTLYQLAEDLRSVADTSISIRIENSDGTWGTIPDTVFDKFIRDPQNFLVMLCIRPPIELYNNVPAVLAAPDTRVYAFTGFMVSKQILAGGKIIDCVFRDLNYWQSNFEIGTDYAIVERDVFIAAMAAKLPFVLDTEIDVTELPAIWDMRDVVAKRDLGWFGHRDGFEICRLDSDFIWMRWSDTAMKLSLVTGSVDAVAVAPPYQPLAGLEFVRWLYDSAHVGIDNPNSKPQPKKIYIDPDSGENFVPKQDFYWSDNSVYFVYQKDVGGLSYTHIRTQIWDDVVINYATTFLNYIPIIDLSETDILIDHLSGTGIVSSKTFHNIILFDVPVIASWLAAIPLKYYPRIRTGIIRQYIHGHTIGGVVYPLLGEREDGTWVWSRITGATIATKALDHKDAFIVGDNAERAASVPKNECYRVNNSQYPNHIAFTERGDDKDYIVIVNDKFELKERLYCGQRPPRTGFVPVGYEISENIRCLTLLGDDYTPGSLGVFPQDETDGLHVVKFIEEVPTHIPRLKSKEMAVGVGLSKSCKCFGAWLFIRPDMVLQCLNTGAAAMSEAIDIRPVVRDGDADIISEWQQQFDKVEADYGKDRQKSIGKTLWSDKKKTLDLKDMVYSSHYTHKIIQQAYLIYNPFHKDLTSDLTRRNFFLLWGLVSLHGVEWTVLSTEVDLLNGVSAVHAVEGLLAYKTVTDELVNWIRSIGWIPNTGDIFIGQLNPLGVPYGGWGVGYYRTLPAELQIQQRVYDLLLEIVTDANTAGIACGEFDEWWFEHEIDYWDTIVGIMQDLNSIGWFDL